MPHFSLLIRVITVLIMTVGAANHATGATYYVRTNGNDTNNGAQASTAFKTIKKAAKAIKSGDVVYVGAGTYTDDIVVNGVQDSTLPAKFIADSGDVIVAAQWKVINCNYLEITGFKFQGTANRFLIWKGSYEGLLKDCQFSAGDEGLLVKSGSLTIENCQIQDFTYDGIQVDGEANLLVKDSTISGCQQSGMQIRKIASVEFDNCTVSGQVGAGIEVNVVEDSIDVESTGVWRGNVPFVGSAGPIGTSANTRIYGDVHRPAGYYVDPSRVTGDIYDLDPSVTFSPVNPGDAATNNDNGSIPLTNKGRNAFDGSEFDLDGNDYIDLPPGTYYFTKMETNSQTDLRISGPTVIYVSGDIWIKGLVNNSTLNPQNLQIFGMGTNLTIQSHGSIYASIYAPSSAVQLLGDTEIHGMAIAASLDLAGQAKIYPDVTLEEFAEVLIPAPLTTPTAPPSWTPVTSGILNVSESTFSGNANGIRMVTEQNFISRYTDYTSNSNYGLELFGPCQIEDLNINSNGVGGIYLNQTAMGDLTVRKLEIADNTKYGVYAEMTDLAFDSNNIDDWEISGSQIALALKSCDISLSDVSIEGGSTAAVQLTQGNMTAYNTTFSGSGYGLAIDDSNVVLTNCAFSGNTVGLYASQNDSLSVSGSTFTGNTLWGAMVVPSGTTGETATFSSCTFNNNAGGLTLVDALDGDVLLRGGTVIRDNTAAGLHFENCDLAVNDQAGGANWSTLRNKYGISCNGSTLAFSNISVQDSTSHNIHCEDSTVSLSGCTVIGRHGIFADAANDSLTIETSVFDARSGAGFGVIHYGGTLDVRNTTFDGYWVGVYQNTSDGVQATFLNTTIANSTGFGMYLGNGDSVVRNTILTGDGTGYGLVRIAGSLTHTNNLLHGFSTPFYGTSADVSEVLNDPRFVDAANGDFHLAVGSRAIGAGMDVGALVPLDMEGNVRPSYKAYEIGAYEFMSPSGSLRVLEWSEKK